MYKIFVTYLMLSLLLLACKNKGQQKDSETNGKTTEISMIKSERPITRLNSKSQELIATWPEYLKFDELITQYQEISMSEALLNSVELSELAQQLKDSIRVEKLNIPEVKIRLNVLHSETKRMADMSTIPSITANLVQIENNNMIEAYSALNLKINNMNAQEELNEEIGKFVDEILEESKIDSTETSIEDNSGN